MRKSSPTTKPMDGHPVKSTRVLLGPSTRRLRRGRGGAGGRNTAPTAAPHHRSEDPLRPPPRARSDAAPSQPATTAAAAPSPWPVPPAGLARSTSDAAGSPSTHAFRMEILRVLSSRAGFAVAVRRASRGSHGWWSAHGAFPDTGDPRAVAGADHAKSHAQSWHCHCTCSYVRVHYVSESIRGQETMPSCFVRSNHVHCGGIFRLDHW